MASTRLHKNQISYYDGLIAPILGDDRYGNDVDRTQLPLDLLPLNTLMLHSSSLELQVCSDLAENLANKLIPTPAI